MQHPLAPNHPIFRIYDAVDLICEYVEHKQLAALAIVSRSFFNCAIPRIWERLYGIRPLLRLIGGPRSENEFQNGGSPEQLVSQLELSRFKFYSPFVKYLDIEADQGPTKWTYLYLVSIAGSPPLPNFRHFRFSSGSEVEIEPKLIPACVSGLFCPTLKEIRLPPQYSLWIEPHLASYLVNILVNAAPSVEKLGIFIRHQSGFSYSESTIFKDITQLHGLRVLECTSALLNPEILELLGALPLLESLHVEAAPLHVFQDDEVNIQLDGLLLPKGSFPKLVHLSLHSLPCSVISQLWKYPSIVRKLVSIDLSFSIYSEGSINTVLQSVCMCSPLTQELSLKFFEGNIEEPDLPTVFIDNLQALSLRCLRIRDAYVLRESYDSFIRSISAWPHIEYLEIPTFRIAYEELVHIAKCAPKLRLLSVVMNRDDWPRDPVPGSVTPSPSALCLKSVFLFEMDFGVRRFSREGRLAKHLEHVARNLRMLWPSGVSCEEDDMFNVLKGDIDIEYMQLLQEKILSGLKHPNLLKSGECLTSWQYEFRLYDTQL
ncbi:fanconi anemia group M protein [Ceratobasidium sp. AG-Ba]|nr:fanconi anemia group M protein [Ceratobasidium sp. AG-Ba]